MRYQTLRLTKFYKDPADEQNKTSNFAPLGSSSSSIMSSSTSRSLLSTATGGKSFNWSSLTLGKQSSRTTKGHLD